MRNLLTDVKHDRHSLILTIEVKHRGVQITQHVHVPWKYLATDDIVERLSAERHRRHRPFQDPAAPTLPLESWE